MPKQADQKEKKTVTRKIKKPKTEKPEKKEEKREELKEKTKAEKIQKYFQAVGRRKTAVARVRLFAGSERGFFVNEKPLQDYFPIPELSEIAAAALKKMHCDDKFRVTVKVKGGGLHSQAEAIRHATGRALILFNPDFRKRLKKAGYLTRDSRMRERKKFGLKRARRAPQWQKR